MKILNNTPFEVQVLPTDGPENKPVLTIVVKGTFDIYPGERAIVAAEQIPVASGDEFYDGLGGGSVKFEADIAPFKPRADIALVGKAYAPKGREVRALDVAFRVGNVRKTIRVIGDRHWICSSRLLPEHPSKPQPFTSMDLVYERAFGGIDMVGGDWCKENLIGRGFFAKKSKKTLDGALLPNLEDPNHLIKSWKDHPKPVGFGFYGKAWMPRAGYLGTYDDKWREQGSPEPPEDFRFDYYNAAHPDLQVEGYLKGDEEVELVNLTPEGTIRFLLPGIKVSCTVTKCHEPEMEVSPASGEGEGGDSESRQETDLSVEEVSVNLDTLCLIPDEKRLYLVWRGLCPIKDLDAAEVDTIQVR